VFGSETSFAPVFALSGVPFSYHQLDTPVARVFDVEVYGGKFWVAGVVGAELAVHNWWDGADTGTQSQYSRIYQDKLYRPKARSCGSRLGTTPRWS
jgi:hypothetical protein